MIEGSSPESRSQWDETSNRNVISSKAENGHSGFRVALFVSILVLVAASAVTVTMNHRVNGRETGIDDHVTTLGSFEVTAQLIEIRGKFLPNDNLYNYAFFMKYQVIEVHRGKLEEKQFIVAHYNPLKPRPAVADEFYPDIGGTLKKFKTGDTHRMALEMPIDDFYIGGLIDRYFQDQEIPRYWGLWTNRVQ